MSAALSFMICFRFSSPGLIFCIGPSYAKSRLSPIRYVSFDMSHDIFSTFFMHLRLLIERRVAACHHHILCHNFSILKTLPFFIPILSS